MSKIITLDKNLVNQIAAGEVVERPVSVVKEIVENSIDAGASFIKVEISGGGKEEIIVSDNGNGIDKDDLSLSLQKYSTSKINSLDDLYNVMTFGFRGEALASISSVSKFQIISKTKASNFAYSISLDNGKQSELSKKALDNGTKIIVRDLFHNTPARLNYLKKDSTETSHITEFLNNISLSYPHIGFEFISNGKTVFKYSSKENLKTRIYNIYNKEFSDSLIEINFDLNGLNISGYISDPKVSFNNRNRQVLLVNNRVIKSPIIYKAISNAYNRFIPHSCFPGYVINLQINPLEVDVNVHPRKMEVRFANEQSIFSAFYHAIENELKKVSLVTGPLNQSPHPNPFPNSSNQSPLPNPPPKGEGTGKSIGATSLHSGSRGIELCSRERCPGVEIERGLGFDGERLKSTYYTGSGTKFKSYSPYKDISSNPDQFKIRDSLDFTKEIIGRPVSIETGLGGDLHYTALGRIIGQSFNSYIIVETDTGIKMLDQHALAERVIYEKLVRNKYDAKTQGLLIGENLNLTSIEINILKENRETFEKIGFDIEFMSGNMIIINSIPDFIKKENIKNIFLGILKDIGEEKSKNLKTLDEVRNRIFAYTACRSAIKFGNKLNLFEMNTLLNDSALDYSATCPHGRPVIYEIGLDELKGKYER